MVSDKKISNEVKGELKERPLNRIHILFLIDRGKTNKEIYDYFGVTPQALNYHLKKLKEQDLISKIEGSYPARHQLKKKAKGLLKKFTEGTLEGGFRRFIHFHHAQYSAPLHSEGKLKPDKTWKANGTLNKYQDLGEVSIHWYGHTISINIHSMFGQDPHELQERAKQKAQEIANKLQEDLNVKMGVLTESKKPHWEVVDPTTVSIGKLMSMSSDELDINDSWDMGAGAEFKDPDDAKRYFLDMPKEIKEIKEVMNQYAEQIQLHLKVTKQIQEQYQKDQEIRQETLEAQKKLNNTIDKLNNKIDNIGEKE